MIFFSSRFRLTSRSRKAMILSVLIILFFFGAGLLFRNKSGNTVFIKGHEFKVEIADTQYKQHRGLSNRDKICDDCGMLFVFKEKIHRAFVMRDMKFSLDILFIDGDRIAKIYENLPPEGSNPKILYQSGQPVNKVLELNAGSAKKFNIKTGDKIK